ncbi:hypothetical protein BC941DRAFT_468907 [Chlamydoabsidia padenii]|nr:hypothetical protein BC941DRAFT_468907 [Chlamydoabsidia padenii]
MESSVSDVTHGTARLTTISRPSVASMNKPAQNTLLSQRPQQVYVALPPLTLNNSNLHPIRKHSLDSKTSATRTSSFHSSSPLASSPNESIDHTTPQDWFSSCQTILFAISTLQQSLQQCLRISSGSLTFFTPLIHQLQHAHDQLVSATGSGTHNSLLSPFMNLCINTLRDTCTQLHSRRDDLTLVLDLKSMRHLLLALHGVTLDIKEVWETLSPQPSTLSATRHRSHSDHHFTPNGTKTATAGTTTTTTSALYAYFKMAVSSSSHLVEVLNQSIESMLLQRQQDLETKLAMLQQPIQQAVACTHQLNEHLEDQQGGFHPSSQSYTIQFWEDTNLFLKTIVSLMSLIRSLSTEDEVNWPKSLKQCCLHLTRVTAEIAKLWNNDPMFVQDGYYLGKTGDDSNNNTLTPTTVSSPLSSSVPSTFTPHQQAKPTSSLLIPPS